MGMLSVVIPAYNEGEMVARCAGALAEILEAHNIPFELIFVDDGSKDSTWKEIEKCRMRDQRVHGISFSRNFGKEAAVFAGLSQAAGDCCAVIDCDLQHPPQAIPEMYRLWLDGFEVVEGKKLTRGREGVVHKLFSKLFYSLLSKSTGVDMKRTSDFKLLDRKAVDAILSLQEQHVFFRALSSWVGFKTATVDYEVQERTSGTSKWSKLSLFSYAFRNISSFSTLPLQIVTILGVITLVVSLVLCVQTLYVLFTGNAQAGFPTVILLILLIGSIIMISLGIIGYYIAKIYEEVRGRPKYIISEKTDELSPREVTGGKAKGTGR